MVFTISSSYNPVSGRVFEVDLWSSPSIFQRLVSSTSLGVWGHVKTKEFAEDVWEVKKEHHALNSKHPLEVGWGGGTPTLFTLY